MSQKTNDKEFKLNAVKLYLTNKDTKSIKAIAEDLGISQLVYTTGLKIINLEEIKVL